MPEHLAWYEQMRRESPVAQGPRPGIWDVFGYADVRTALFDHAVFSSARAMGGGAGSILGESLIATDQPIPYLASDVVHGPSALPVRL